MADSHDPLGWNKAPKFDRTGLDPLNVQMLATDSNEFAFEIARQNVVEGLTFSAEAFDEFLRSVSVFLGSRVVRHWEDTGEPPQRMRIVVKTYLDGGKHVDDTGTTETTAQPESEEA